MSDELPLVEGVKNLGVEESASEQENGQQTPERGKDTIKKATQARRKLDLSSSVGENEEGKWLQNHPWQDRRPGLEMDHIINESKPHPLPKQWKDERTRKIDLRTIYNDLPEFVNQMRGKSEREMLKQYLEAKTEKDRQSKMTAHMKEIMDELEDKKPEDKESFGNQSYKAYSLKQTNHENRQKGNIRHLDCEYMLKMYLPENRQTWFKVENTPSGLIRAINSDKKDNRWIFTPSFRRAEIALLDWPNDEIVTQESTIRILVVRPCEFEKYVERCGHMFPIISLPNDEIGVGYARFWIQKIALRLKLDFIWMIDDSVECFYEYDPDEYDPDEESKGEGFYKKYRRRQFGLVFERIEGFFKPAGNIAAMSPRGIPPGRPVYYPFTSKPPQAAVYLNLKALKDKEVFYRPELKIFEDMMFGYECYMNGLDVFRDNRVQLQDHRWKDTGAMYHSVQPPQESE